MSYIEISLPSMWVFLPPLGCLSLSNGMLDYSDDKACFAIKAYIHASRMLPRYGLVGIYY